ncbi:MAG: ATP-binding protein [Chloroflexota bacterium]
MTTLSELTLQQIVDNLPHAVVIVAENGDIRLSNSSARSLSPGLKPNSTWESAGLLFSTDPELLQRWMSLQTAGATSYFKIGSTGWHLESKNILFGAEHCIQITGREAKKEPVQFVVDKQAAEITKANKLLEITNELSYLLEEELVLEKALQLINETIDADEGLILLTDEVTGEFVVRAEISDGQSPTLTEKPTGIWPNQGLAGWVLRTRQAVLVSDTEKDKRWIRAGSAKKETGPLVVRRSVLAAPLEFGHEPIGVLMLTSPIPQKFNNYELGVVREATRLLSNALYNAHLYDLIRNQGARLGGMLREEQINAAKNQSILESIADGVLVVDQSGEIILANDAFIDIFERPRWEILGNHITSMVGFVEKSGDIWFDAVKSWAVLEPNVTAGEVVEDSIVLPSSDKTVRVSLAPVFAAGQFFGTVSIFKDITREIEADLAKTSFVSLVSHELRTPLTSIRGYTDLMLMGAAGGLPEPVEKYVKIIQSNAKRLHELVGDILLITQFDGGDMPLTVAPTDIESVIDNVVNNHLKNRINVENRSVDVAVEVSRQLPKVMADEGRVVQILTNLVDNALNYTMDQGEITVSARSTAEAVFVSVRDTGIGITVEEIDRVFDRFYRSEDNQVRKIAGTGLGLSIAKTFVDMHSGTLTVSSEYGVGSTFTFSLPLVESNS